MSYFLPPQAEHLCWLVLTDFKKILHFLERTWFKKSKNFFIIFRCIWIWEAWLLEELASMESSARSFSVFARWFHIKTGFLAFSKMPEKSTGKTFHHFHKTVVLCSKHQRSATIIYFELFCFCSSARVILQNQPIQPFTWLTWSRNCPYKFLFGI